MAIRAPDRAKYYEQNEVTTLTYQHDKHEINNSQFKSDKGLQTSHLILIMWLNRTGVTETLKVVFFILFVLENLKHKIQ